MTRALVLGGGGLVGIAWEAGVLQGLRESGLDTTAWDLVVGTSGGAIVGAKVLAEPDFDAFVRTQLVEAGPEDDRPIRRMGGRLAAFLMRLGRRPGLRWAPGIWVLLFGLETFVRQRAGRRRRPPARPADAPAPGRLRPFTGPDPMLARLGDLGLSARTAPEPVYREIVAETLAPVADWPDRLVVTALDVETGAGYALDATSGVPFVDAVAATCAVPTFMPMVTIGGRFYMDGGMASQTHAVLARGHDEVVVVAPLDLGRLDAEVEGLRASGSRVTVVSPGPEARRVVGRSVALLDPARRARAARAGVLDGRRAAEAAGVARPGTASPPPRLAGSES